MTAGTGTDIVAVRRIATLIERRGLLFLRRWFTADEIEYCNAKAKPSRHFAARFASTAGVRDRAALRQRPRVRDASRRRRHLGLAVALRRVRHGDGGCRPSPLILIANGLNQHSHPRRARASARAFGVPGRTVLEAGRADYHRLSV